MFQSSFLLPENYRFRFTITRRSRSRATWSCRRHSCRPSTWTDGDTEKVRINAPLINENRSRVRTAMAYLSQSVTTISGGQSRASSLTWRNSRRVSRTLRRKHAGGNSPCEPYATCNPSHNSRAPPTTVTRWRAGGYCGGKCGCSTNCEPQPRCVSCTPTTTAMTRPQLPATDYDEDAAVGVMRAWTTVHLV